MNTETANGGSDPETEPSVVVTAFATAVGAAWIERDVIDVIGPDAASYLQGQISQDVEALAIGHSRRTLVLQPQGKIDAWMRLTRLGEDRYLLDVDAGYGQAALERLVRFKLRVDCELSLTTVATLAVRGPAAADGPGPVGVEPGPEAVVVDALWPGVAGFDVIGPAEIVGSSVVVASAAALDALRINLGLPTMGAELDSSTIPAAAGIVDESVDFDKGCYVGQELVARIDSRGSNTPTNLRGLILPEGANVDAGAAIMVGDSEVGAITSVAGFDWLEPSGSPSRRALAYIRRTVEVPADATVAATDGTVAATVVQLPFG